MFVFKIFIDFLGSGVEFVKKIQVKGDMENSWSMFDHIKRWKNKTIMTCHMYNSQYCKVLTIV